MSTTSLRRVLMALVAGGALMVASFAAASPANASTLYACVKKNGSARLFGKKPKCKKGEKLLSWNNVGPAGKNGANGPNGTAGKEGAGGKEGVAGQPQKSSVFAATLEAPVLSNTEKPLFSVDGVSVKLDCVNVLFVNVANLEATAPTNSVATSGMVAHRSNNKEPLENFQQMVYNVGLTPSSSTVFASLITNVKGVFGNVGHVNASIITPSAIVLIDTFLEAKEDPEACKVSGVAFSIPR